MTNFPQQPIAPFPNDQPVWRRQRTGMFGRGAYLSSEGFNPGDPFGLQPTDLGQVPWVSADPSSSSAQSPAQPLGLRKWLQNVNAAPGTTPGGSALTASNSQLSLNPSQCPAVPSGGPGEAVLQKNMQDARALAVAIHRGSDWSIFDGANKNEAVAMAFAQRVRTGGLWDTKSLTDASGKKLYPNGQDFGDFQYGALAHSMGFSWPVAMAAAHAYSLKSGHGLETKMPMIRSGYLYAARGCK